MAIIPLMIKNRNLKVGQSEEISNLFVRSRKEFKHKQKQVPKELEWLLEGFDLWAAKPHKTLHYQSVT